MAKSKEFKKLEKENEKIREKINQILLLYFPHDDIYKLWEFINNLIDNEIEQEKFCNE